MGRWVAEQSDDYMRTAREVVGGLQTQIAAVIRDGTYLYREDEIYERIEEHLQRAQVEPEKIANQINKFKEFDHWFRTASRTTVLATAEESARPAEDADGFALPAPTSAAQEEEPETEADSLIDVANLEFFVVQTGSAKNPCKRLHRLHGRCPTKPERDTRRFVWVTDFDNAEYNAVCLRCWPPSDFDRQSLENSCGRTAVEEAGEASSEDDSSTDDEVEAKVD